MSSPEPEPQPPEPEAPEVSEPEPVRPVMRRRSKVGAPPAQPPTRASAQEDQAVRSAHTEEQSTLPSPAQEQGERQAELRELEGLLGYVDRMREGLPALERGQQPPFCRARLPGASASRQIVGIRQRLDRMNDPTCEPFTAAREPSIDLIRDYRRLATTLDGAERSASTVASYNEPRAIADEVVAAVERARRAIEGIDGGGRPFPCDHAVWSDLRRLGTSENGYSAAAARRVTQKQGSICRTLGLGRGNLQNVARRTSDQLDEVEGDIRSAIRPLRSVLGQ